LTATTFSVLETPIEHTGSDLNILIQTFNTVGQAYDNTLKTDIQNAYRRAIRGYHPTDTSSTNKATLAEFNDYLNEALSFTDMENLDGVTAGGSDLYPTNYRLWKATGGAVGNPNGADRDLADSNGMPIDMGKWLSLCTLHGKSSNSFGDQFLKLLGYTNERAYVSTGVGEYLALVLKLPEKDSTTNRAIEGFASERDIRRSIADSLVASRYIVTNKDPNGGYIVIAGNTAAYMIDSERRSDYSFLTTVRIVQKTLQGVRRIVAPYIGQALTSIAFRAIKADLTLMYQDLARDNYIDKEFQFDITQTEDQKVLGYASFVQLITPAYELRKVFGETNLKK
jgi:hypothetical protein